MAFAVVALGAVCALATATKQPHILFVLSDDLGYNDVGFHGSEIKTPFIDSLVADGVHFDNYYGHAICTPSRSAIMSGRFASHNGLQHSYLLTGTDVGLPLKFKTLANHLGELGYNCSMVGKWHLGFQSEAYTPLGRGFGEYFGYLTGGEDYFTHEAGGYLDLHENGKPAPQYNTNYSTPLFATKAATMVEKHDTNYPMFLYLAFQSVHSPLEAPQDYIEKFNWITNTKRRTLAAMANCMDDAIKSLVDTYKSKNMWSNTLMVFAADNGGPPYVANSNWPMRGGKWTMWEGGTHLTAFAHHGGGLLPKKNFTGLAHHADWVATLVSAAGGVLNDTVIPAPDSVSLWDGMISANASVEGPRTHVLLNVDQTNQITENDPGGWSGYAGIVVKMSAASEVEPGLWKLVLGNPGVPNDWCWPNQNSSTTGSIETCNMIQGFAFPGNDIVPAGVAATTPAACCTACQARDGCEGWTFHSSADDNGKNQCWIKANISSTDMDPCTGCTSGSNGTSPLPPHPTPPSSGPMPDNSSLSCSFNGKVPVNRTGAILFDLSNDPMEKVNLAAERPDLVAMIRPLLQKYIDSAVEPLNLTPSERKEDPAAVAAAKQAGCWVPWQKESNVYQQRI